MKSDKIGTRMKNNYENASKTKLTRRIPVIIRLDGRAFHTFTKGFKKPFDEAMQNAMANTALELCRNVQGCKMAYTQSDEISLLLTDFDRLTSDAWFDYEVQKVCSITASMATLYFNKAFVKEVKKEGERLSTYNNAYIDFEEVNKIWLKHKTAAEKGAMFDARCFNIPKEEAANYFYWRQLDAIRNSIEMVGQASYSHKQLMNKSCKDIKSMLLDEKGINWDRLPIKNQRGLCVICTGYGWIVDEEIPIFKNEGREYIETYITEKTQG